MSVVFTRVDALASLLADLNNGPAIIGVDGWSGVGKTTLARNLANAVKGSAYDIDSALDRDKKSFVPSLRLDEIRTALSSPARIIFVSGVCLRQVLQGATVSAVAHIYLKRMASWGWADEDELVEQNNAVALAEGGGILRQEMRDYHAEWQPHIEADYEFQRFD